MTNRALVERDSATENDDHGLKGVASWATHLTALACYAFQKARTEIVDGVKTVVISELRLLVPSGTDITEDDRVNGITDRAGSTLFAGLFAVEAVERFDTHLEVRLQRVFNS